MKGIDRFTSPDSGYLKGIAEAKEIAKSRVKLLNDITEAVITGLEDGLNAKEIAGNIEVILETRTLHGEDGR